MKDHKATEYVAHQIMVRPWMPATAKTCEYPGVAVFVPDDAVGVTVTPLHNGQEVAVCWLEPVGRVSDE